MSVSNGQAGNASTFNNAFMSRTKDTSTTGKVALENSDTPAIADAQAQINQNTTDIAAHVGETVDAHAASAISTVASGGLASTNVQAALVEHQSDIDALEASKIGVAEKGAASGVAPLDANSKIPAAHIPALALVDVSVVADIAARDALVVQEGDVAKVTSEDKTYIYDGAAWILVGGSSAELAAHIANTSNPHNVTPAQVGNATAQWNANKIQGRDVASTAPVDGQGLKWSATSNRWEPGAVAGAGGGGGALNLIEGGDAESGVKGNTVGGTATVTVSTSSPLRGTSSFLYTPSSTAGHGWQFSFNADAALVGKEVQLKITHQIATGTYTNGELYFFIQSGGVTQSPANTSISSGSSIGEHLVYFTIAQPGLQQITLRQNAGLTGYTMRFEIELSEVPTQAIYNAKKIQSVPVSATAPVSGQGLIYDGTSWKPGAVGSSGGGINYISNADAETDTLGWFTYANADGVAPTNGTGGSPTITWSRSTASPLRGTASFRLTKPAGNVRGQGVSFAYSHPGKVETNQISFEYKVISGTYATGDIRVYLVDVTTGAVIEPVNVQVQNAGLTSDHLATFQTTNASTSYRFCIHIASASTSAYTIDFDGISVGPQVKSSGALITEPKAFTPTVSNLGTGGATILSGMYERQGAWAVGHIAFQKDASAGSGAVPLTFHFSSIGAIDTSKLVLAGTYNVGTANFWTSASGFDELLTLTYSTSTGGLTVCKTGTGSGLSGADIPASTQINIWFRIPIVGWGSSQVLSSDVGGRTIALEVQRDANATGLFVNGTSSKATWTTVHTDTVGGWDATNNRYIIQEPGQYEIQARVRVSAVAAEYAPRMEIRINNSTVTQDICTKWGTTLKGHDIFNAPIVRTLKAGDYVEAYVYNDSGSNLDFQGNATVGANRFTVKKVGGTNQQIAASETVSCRYTTAAGQSAANNTIINFGTRDWDTHGAVTTGASWRFTAPTSGVYRLNVMIEGAAAAASIGSYFSSRLFKNGVPTTYVGVTYAQTTTNMARIASGSTTVRLLAGEYFDVRVEHNTSVTNLTGALSTNYLEIDRVGNY